MKGIILAFRMEKEQSAMSMKSRAIIVYHAFLLIVGLIIALHMLGAVGLAQTPLKNRLKETAREKPEKNMADKITPKVVGPADKLNRGVPRTSVIGFMEAAGKGDYKCALEYLDLRFLPKGISKGQGPELARQLKIILDRSLWIDPILLSDNPNGHIEDGLPSYRDLLTRIDTKKGAYDILLQRVPRGDGVFIWKFSNITVGKIPELYSLYGYGRVGDFLSMQLPGFEIFGVQLWQWIGLLSLCFIVLLISFLFMRVVARIVRHKEGKLREGFAKILSGPGWVLMGVLLARANVELISPTVALRSMMRHNTIMIVLLIWVLLRLTNLAAEAVQARFDRNGRGDTKILLRPVATIIKVVIVLIAVMAWLDNLGFNVSTVLASIGVGGLAIALAAQDTLKNLFGGIIIILDKPFQVGQRIIAQGNDGIVEAIGLRSTQLRLLNGNQANIPNEIIARVNIENIGRRPHIRRLTNISIPYGSPLKKVKKAVDIIQGILEDHEGMDPEFPPRVYFNEFNDDSLNIMMLYWYRPADYWAFNAFNEKVNLQIMEEFEKEGIEFALPTTTTHLVDDKKSPIRAFVSDEI